MSHNQSPNRQLPTAEPIYAIPMNTDPNGNMFFNSGDISSASLYSMDETIERSGNLFTQLDSMIAAVQLETTALDQMKEKLKELDHLRVQLSTLTKRLLEADQTNLTLKGNLVKVQEAYGDLKKAKSELEQTIVPLRQEINRHKELYSKERMARLAAQQEVTMLKDQLNRLEKLNEDLEREVKTIPAITESNEILKNDLSQLRIRYKDDKSMLQNQLRQHESAAREVETLKGDVRHIAMRLLDISGGPGKLAAPSQQQQQPAPQSLVNPQFRSSGESPHKKVQYDYGFDSDGGSSLDQQQNQMRANRMQTQTVSAAAAAIARKRYNGTTSKHPRQHQQQQHTRRLAPMDNGGGQGMMSMDANDFDGTSSYLSGGDHGDDDDFDQSFESMSQYPNSSVRISSGHNGNSNGGGGGGIASSQQGLTLPRINV